MINWILWAFFLYFMYKFITKFVIPVGTMFLKVRKQIKQVKKQFNDHQPEQFSNNDAAKTKAGATSTAIQHPAFNDEYIDFEEIKKQ